MWKSKIAGGFETELKNSRAEKGTRGGMTYVCVLSTCRRGKGCSHEVKDEQRETTFLLGVVILVQICSFTISDICLLGPLC